jgi:hypothetical protein
VSQLTYENDAFSFEVDGDQYSCEVSAEAEYCYEPMVMYYKDGSGYPGSEELEIEKLEIKNVKDVDGNVVSLTDEMEEAVDNKLQEMDLADWNGYCEDGLDD